jgi:hypothetical protein
MVPVPYSRAKLKTLINKRSSFKVFFLCKTGLDPYLASLNSSGCDCILTSFFIVRKVEII